MLPDCHEQNILGNIYDSKLYDIWHGEEAKKYKSLSQIKNMIK